MKRNPEEYRKVKLPFKCPRDAGPQIKHLLQEIKDGLRDVGENRKICALTMEILEVGVKSFSYIILSFTQYTYYSCAAFVFKVERLF